MVVHIVVTEGLSNPQAGETYNEILSDYFEAVLQNITQNTVLHDTVLISPGNAFGHPKSEEDYAADYLRKKRPDLKIIVPQNIRDRPYLDTFDNARLLRKYLEQQHKWPTEPAILYCNYPHAFRSFCLFKLCGFLIKEVRGSHPQEINRNLVPRLWFYDYLPLQILYETAAFFYNLSRWLVWSVKGNS